MANKFKIGDEVEVIDESAFFEIGNKGVIVKGEDTSVPFIKVGEKIDLISENSLRLINSKEPSIFKVGDKIEITGNYDGGNGKIEEGMIGKICKFNKEYNSVGIEFDENIQGHSCDGNCEDYHGYYVGYDGIKLIEPKREKVKNGLYCSLTDEELAKVGGEMKTKNKGLEKPPLLIKLKHMASPIREAFMSKESKAVKHFGLGYSKRTLNPEGLMEYLAYLYETDDKVKTAFLDKLVEAHKEVKKNR